MKKGLTVISILIAALCSCSKDEGSATNDSAKYQFEAWVSKYYPSAQKTDWGAYVVSEEEGNGEEVGTWEDNQFVRIEYTARYFDGTVFSYSGADQAKKLYEYDSTYYYGPLVLNRAGTSNIAGLDESFCQMKVGGSREVIIPGWLTTYLRYDNAKDFYNNVTGTNVIYDFKIVDAFNDADEWEIEQITDYISSLGLDINSFENDTTGFYYLTTKAPDNDELSFEENDTYTINYTGMRLDGQIFDTTIRNIAVKAGIYSDDNTYETQEVTYNEDYSSITLGSSSVIDGFGMALAKMRPGEKCTVIFISSLGYEGSGSGLRINGYCPLRFDIEMVDYEIDEEE